MDRHCLGKHGWSGLPLNLFFHGDVGNAVEQHGTGAGRHVAVFPVEAERHLTGIEYDTRGAQPEGSLFQALQDLRANAPAPIFRGNAHVTNPGLAYGAEVQPADTDSALTGIDGHEVRAVGVEGIGFAAAGLAPGGAQRFPAQIVVLPEFSGSRRLDQPDL
jgi:hypothetical protein